MHTTPKREPRLLSVTFFLNGIQGIIFVELGCDKINISPGKFSKIKEVSQINNPTNKGNLLISNPEHVVLEIDKTTYCVDYKKHNVARFTFRR